jgi:hypothetical protein
LPDTDSHTEKKVAAKPAHSSNVLGAPGLSRNSGAKHGSFKKAVRRDAQDTDQRYTEALSDVFRVDRGDGDPWLTSCRVRGNARGRFDRLRDQVLSADDGKGLPEALLHGNLLRAPDHAIVSDQGPVAIQWKGPAAARASPTSPT